jgi:L-ascorbate metabolism protein UlaG (beta-lactamase superfamily)
LIFSGPLHLLVDLGAGCYAGIRRAGLTPPAIVCVTHSHPDHLNPMELNTIIRDGQMAGRAKPLLVSTERTWQDISEFHQHRLEFIRIEPGQEIDLDVDNQNVRISAIDASDHWRGGVNYVISAGGFRFGALFDRKTWNGVREKLESLDLALLPANTIYPMSARTGHVSLAETIAFLRSLAKPPRLSLLTHMGHDDAIQLSMGSLAALLHGLAPGMAVNWAYPGMTVDAAHLPPRNPVAVLDEGTNAVVGVADKVTAHAKDAALLHASVLLLAGDADGRLVLYRRDKAQSYPGRLDAFGGHMQPSDGGPEGTALREGTEEIRAFRDGMRIPFESSWLVRLSDDFELESTSPTNRERSTLFGVALPLGVSVSAADETDDGRHVQLEIESWDLDAILKAAAETPRVLADGLVRVATAIQSSAILRQRIEHFCRRDQR